MDDYELLPDEPRSTFEWRAGSTGEGEAGNGQEARATLSRSGGADPICEQCLNRVEEISLGHFAAAVGHLQCLRGVCNDNPYSLLSFDATNRSPLFYASANDRPDCCEYLIDRFPPLINLADASGDTPLHAASNSGSEACVSLLIYKGRAQIDARNKLGMAPAHLGG